MRISDWSSDVCSSDLSPTLLNARPLRSIRDLTDHVILHADEGREWQTWLAAAKALELGKGPHHFMGDARLAMEAALHGNGIALGDTMTASSLMQQGSLVAPFDLAVAAVDSFYVACPTPMKPPPPDSVKLG